MTDPQALADLTGLLADRSRAAICLALIDGRAWTAGELARHVGISAPTASEHLTRLVEGGLLAEVRQGRHRYLRLAGPRVADLVEDLAGLRAAPRPVGLRNVRAADRLAAGRTCYDHLAGDLGVAVYDGLVRRRLLTDDGLTDRGRTWFADLLGPQCLQRHSSRPLVRQCLDWTRRVPHLGGALGAGLCAHALHREWVVRPDGDRAVVMTRTGEAELHTLLGV